MHFIYINVIIALFNGFSLSAQFMKTSEHIDWGIAAINNSALHCIPLSVHHTNHCVHYKSIWCNSQGMLHFLIYDNLEHNPVKEFYRNCFKMCQSLDFWIHCWYFTSHDRPVYPSGQLHCSTSSACLRPVDLSSAVSSEISDILFWVLGG